MKTNRRIQAAFICAVFALSLCVSVFWLHKQPDAASIPLLSEDLDRFWEAAAGKESRGLAQPGSLSYEQAQELGLIRPDEE